MFKPIESITAINLSATTANRPGSKPQCLCPGFVCFEMKCSMLIKGFPTKSLFKDSLVGVTGN